MKVTFTDQAKEHVARYMAPDKKILLDYDDGVGPFSAVGDCSLGRSFQLIFVDKDLSLPDFDQEIDSNIGKIFIKSESASQFEDEMEMRFNKNFFTMPLVSKYDTLTENVEVIDYSGKTVAATTQGKTHDC
ncbi:MAG: iron-sulfur cluster biosynthesis family protein [Limosilactobacillus sp.]|uniref:iron-sulfur cluster biosynthesis family protein n=1 Tax=Limosilactobacillus sp. TaxID=2773925 RepID=UPI0026F86D6B|nr:iron-sulfur cluster biosynthesis family protein [Limosilactobacillus sp.]